MPWHAVTKPAADRKARAIATEEARAAAEATGIFPLEYMLSVMRDPAADHKRPDAMAMAAAPYLHGRVSTIDPKLEPANRGAIGREALSPGRVCGAWCGSRPR